MRVGEREGWELWCAADVAPTHTPPPPCVPPPFSPQGGADVPSSAASPTSPPQWMASGGATGSFSPDPANRPTLLFDLNGVLLANPPRGAAAAAGRRGPPVLRPGMGALARLTPAFRLGVYSSATAHAVRRAMVAVVAAVKADGGVVPDGDALFELVLCRRYCRPAGEVRGKGRWVGGGG